MNSHGVNDHSHLRHKTVHGWMRMGVHDQMRMTVHGRCESSFTMHANTQLNISLSETIILPQFGCIFLIYSSTLTINLSIDKLTEDDC